VNCVFHTGELVVQKIGPNFHIAQRVLPTHVERAAVVNRYEIDRNLRATPTNELHCGMLSFVYLNANH